MKLVICQACHLKKKLIQIAIIFYRFFSTDVLYKGEIQLIQTDWGICIDCLEKEVTIH